MNIRRQGAPGFHRGRISNWRDIVASRPGDRPASLSGKAARSARRSPSSNDTDKEATYRDRRRPGRTRRSASPILLTALAPRPSSARRSATASRSPALGGRATRSSGRVRGGDRASKGRPEGGDRGCRPTCIIAIRGGTASIVAVVPGTGRSRSPSPASAPLPPKVIATSACSRGGAGPPRPVDAFRTGIWWPPKRNDEMLSRPVPRAVGCCRQMTPLPVPRSGSAPASRAG